MYSTVHTHKSGNSKEFWKSSFMSGDSAPLIGLCFRVGMAASSYPEGIVIFSSFFFKMRQLSNHLLPQYEIRKKPVPRKLNFGTRSMLNVILSTNISRRVFPRHFHRLSLTITRTPFQWNWRRTGTQSKKYIRCCDTLRFRQNRPTVHAVAVTRCTKIIKRRLISRGIDVTTLYSSTSDERHRHWRTYQILAN